MENLRLAPCARACPRRRTRRYRGRAGAPTAVVTLSSFPSPPAGRTYQAWVRHGGPWLSLGTVVVDARGNGRLIAERPRARDAARRGRDHARAERRQRDAGRAGGGIVAAAAGRTRNGVRQRAVRSRGPQAHSSTNPIASTRSTRWVISTSTLLPPPFASIVSFSLSVQLVAAPFPSERCHGSSRENARRLTMMKSRV